MSTKINLLPWREEHLLYQNRIFGAMAAVISILIIVMMLAWGGLLQLQVGTQKKSIAYLKQEHRKLDLHLSEIRKLEEEKHSLIDKMKAVKSLQANRPFVVKLFDSIARAIPEGLFITDLSRKDDTLTIDGITESNTRVSLFMRNLEKLSWLISADLIEIKNDTRYLQSAGRPLISYKLQIEFSPYLGKLETLGTLRETANEAVGN